MNNRVCAWIWVAACAMPLGLNAQCVNFPSNLIPFSSVYYVTAADAAGDHLVVGTLAGSLSSISALPVATSVNQTFCGQVQLAPQQVYSNVYVQTAAEEMGNFPEFAGLLTDPNPVNNNAPFAGGVIPPSRLGGVYAFRIGPAQPPQQPAWSLTGSMGQGWVQHVAVLLPTGQVLITGNCQACITTGPVALLYDPPTGTFLPAATPLFTHGAGASGILLNNGQVLIVGGINAPNAAELYNPATNQFAAVGSSSFTHYEFFTSTLLNDGRVLVAGGQNVDNTAVAEAEIFDPSINTFIRIGSMVHARANHTATLLPNGNVLIAGGCNTNQCFNTGEIFNPASQGTFTVTGAMYNTRDGGYALLLPNGKVLVGGGDDSTLPPAAELYDPAKGTFTVTGSMPAGIVERAGATLLSSGQVLIAGGDVVLPTLRTPLVTAELYDPASGSFSLAGNMTVGRELATTTLLPDGRVLLTGGASNSSNTTLYSSAEIYTPVVQGLVTSQTGVTFRAAPGGSPAPQTVQVLSPFSSIPWTLSVKTYSGGNWLSATPTGATSAPGATPTPVSISVNTSGLQAQTYYGEVTLSPTDKVHPPVSITVVLNIVPGGTAAPLQVLPGGLVFVASPGLVPASQSFSILNVSSTAISFTATSASTGKWLSVSQSGVVTSAQPVSITVTPVSGGLTAGSYPGTVTLSFSDGSTQIVNLLLVISPTSKPAARGPVPEQTSSGCTPTQLLPVLTSLSSGFSVSAGWPVPIIAQVVDSCGSAINTGTVVASFTNGDSPVTLIPVGGGSWSATWVPGRGYAGSTVRVDANTVNPGLTGSTLVSAQVASNPTAPVIFPGGVVSAGDYSSAPALGLWTSIYGSGLADNTLTASAAPLPTQLGTTSVLLSSGQALPILFVADSLINVLIPYELAVNSPIQLIVQRDNAISVPTQTVVFSAAPSILSTAGNGMGEGVVYVIGAGGIETPVTTLTPAQPGDPIVIYCFGLGPVTPALGDGVTTPYPPLYPTTAPVTVTFGNVTVSAAFAGLTPGVIGVYQVNVTVPAGVPVGNQVVTVSVGGKSSSASIFMSIR